MKSLFAVLLSCATVVVVGAGIGGRQPAVASPLPAAHIAAAAIDLAVPAATATVPNVARIAPMLVAPAAARTVALEYAAPRTVALPVMPTVYVTASPDDVEDVESVPSVMLDAAVDGAKAAMVGGAARSAQRIGLAVPYFAFAQVSAGGAE